MNDIDVMKQIYYDNLITYDDLLKLKNGCINDDDFYDCLIDNIRDLFNDNIDNIIHDILCLITTEV